MHNMSDINRILEIGAALSKERNMPRLLDRILTEAMEITCCDAGTLYLHEGNMLHFKITKNHTLNIYKGEDEDTDLPPVAIREENVCSYVLLHRTLENIEDVYSSHRFDFSGPKNYDKLTGYRTKSMLVIPLENNRGEVVGVLQLINALDKSGAIIPFHRQFEPLFRSIASQAAIAITNMNYVRENQELLESLVEVLSAAVDERSHYNANHTKHVAEYTIGFIDFINQKHASGKSDLSIPDEERSQIVISAWLHDIGKIAIPLEVMDKSTRLGDNESLVWLRFDTLYAGENIRFLNGQITEDRWEHLRQEIACAKELCARANDGGALTPEEIAYIESLSRRETILPTGKAIAWLTPQEVEFLAISSGTLTASERELMNSHVIITNKLLKKIKFSAQYEKVPLYAGSHHEKLNGTGYPKGLSESQLPMGTRLLTILDVFEALTAEDRPYKKPIPIQKALEILEEMAAAGELDKELVALLKEWKYESI